MFDIGISELMLIGVVALVVLGPERLPKVARTAGHLFGRLQRYVATVKADLNREMDMSELAKVKQEVQEAARAFEQSAQQTTSAIESEARSLSASMEQRTPEPPTPAVSVDPAQANSQSALLASQESGLTEPTAQSPDPASTPARAPTPSLPAAATFAQASFDFGIEPPRTARS